MSHYGTYSSWHQDLVIFVRNSLTWEHNFPTIYSQIIVPKTEPFHVTPAPYPADGSKHRMFHKLYFKVSEILTKITVSHCSKLECSVPHFSNSIPYDLVQNCSTSHILKQSSYIYLSVTFYNTF